MLGSTGNIIDDHGHIVALDLKLKHHASLSYNSPPRNFAEILQSTLG
jgi:hypothetical protein